MTLLDLFTGGIGACGPGGDDSWRFCADLEVSRALKLREALFLVTIARGLPEDWASPAGWLPLRLLRAAAVGAAARSEFDGFANTTTGTLPAGLVGESGPLLVSCSCRRGMPGAAASWAPASASWSSGRPNFLLITAIRLALYSS